MGPVLVVWPTLELKLKKAETRIAARIEEQKRKAEASKRAQAIADEISALGSGSETMF